MLYDIGIAIRRLSRLVALPVVVGLIVLSCANTVCAATSEALPDRMEYYEEGRNYRKPELEAGIIKQKANTWVKRSPLFFGPPSPRLGYEASMDYDITDRKLIRHGGHDQGGGGLQSFETWTYDVVSGAWTLMYPDTSPPGNCCSRTNVIDRANGKFIRFPGFSSGHGWQWARRVANLESSVWAYGLRDNRWINMRPFPDISVGPARAATYDTDDQIILVFNVYGPCLTAAYDLYANTWTLLYPENEPPGKISYNPGFNMTYDQAQRLFILFGVGDGTDPRTFAFDIRKNIWKDMHPAANPTYYDADPVMAYDSRNSVTVCVVANKKRGCLETWAYSAKMNKWQKMSPEKEPDMTGDRCRLLAYSPDQNLIILENRWSPWNWRIIQQQIWTYRYADNAEKDAVPSPRDLRLITTDSSAELFWKRDDKATGYNIYYGIGNKPWLVDYRKIASVKTNRFEHKNLEKGVVHYYYVTALRQGEESLPSLKVRSQPRVVTDIYVSVLSKNSVELEWRPEGEYILGYNVYRLKRGTDNNELESGTRVYFEKVNADVIKGTRFIDNILLDRIYAYRVHAVNYLGVESGPSPYVLTIPSPPSYVFSKEKGADCMLKWGKNPEKSVIGYNIYRTGYSKYDDKHELLNRQPIKAQEFIDVNATRDMPMEPSNTGRRYYVTAVDSIGQESYPSSPVWFYREWRKFYKVGVWHQ